MSGRFTKVLQENEVLHNREAMSNKKITELRSLLDDSLNKVESRRRYCCFCAGSLARGDCGEQSDLDVFMMYAGRKSIATLDKYKIYGHIIEVNNNMKFPELSNDGQYLQLHSLSEMEKTLGEPKDDYINLFTTRMLLLLESRPVFNDRVYDSVLKKVIDLYFRDKDTSGDDFLPMFILNDIFRYWRTMCLNYETIRNDKNRPWRKKNINLKFSRMLSVYSSVIPAMLGYAKTQSEWIELCMLTPLKRISTSLDRLDDDSLIDKYSEFLDAYCSFLEWKDMKKSEVELFLADDENKYEMKNKAEIFSDFIYSVLSHKSVDRKMKKFIAI